MTEAIENIIQDSMKVMFEGAISQKTTEKRLFRSYQALSDIVFNLVDDQLEQMHPEWQVELKSRARNNSRINLSNFPMIKTRYRYRSANWNELPYFSWRIIERIDEKLVKMGPGISIGYCYYPVWIQLSEVEQQDKLQWIFYKLSIKSAHTFKSHLKNPEKIPPHFNTSRFINSIFKGVNND